MNNWNAGSSKRRNAGPCVHKSPSLVTTVAPDDVLVGNTPAVVHVEVEMILVKSPL